MSGQNTWNKNGLTYTEILCQGYGGNNCIISAGFVDGENQLPVDTVYLFVKT